tara:strand:- start:6161 stop:8482 length:2322 start_codon:yes stop_codon:yes gene_type:complete
LPHSNNTIELSNELFQRFIQSPENFGHFLRTFPGVAYRLSVDDEKGKVVYITESIESLTGYSPANFLQGKITFADLIPEEELKQLTARFLETEKKGDFFSFEYTLIDKLGVNHRVITHSHIVRDKDGKAVWVDGTLTDITASSETKEELKRVISINRNFINSSPNVIFAKNVNGVYKMANKALADFMGVSVDEIIGKSDKDFDLPEAKLEEYKKQDQFVITKGESLETSPTFISSNGKTGWYTSIKSPIKASNGKVEGLIAIVTDVTELIESKEIIREQQELLETVYNSGTDVITVLTPKNNEFYYETVNAAYLELLRRFGVSGTSDELKGLNMLQHAVEHGIFTQEKSDEARKELEKVLETRSRHSFTEITDVPNSNLKVYIDVEINPILGAEGNVKHIVYRGHDFSDVMRFNKQLQEREELFESINRNVQDGIYRSTVNTGLRYANDSMCRLFGYTIKELSRVRPTDLYAIVGDRQKIIEELQRTGFFSDREVLFKRKDGSTFWGLLSCSMTLEADGNRVIDGIVVDVTADRKVKERLKSTNESLRKINSELDHLVYRTSHDLRSPLVSVMGLLELMRMEGVEGNLAEYLSIMEDQVVKLDKVILDIINIRKIAKTGLQRELVDCKEIIDDVFESIKFLDRFNKIKKQVSITNDAPLYQDKNNIKIILNNVLSNAVKYAKKDIDDSFISVDIKIDSKKCSIKIKDNGIGIREKNMDKVFEMFYRATDVNQGTGLGLFIVREAVNKLKGSINVDSKEGEWTRFIIEIPNLTD